MSYDDAIHALSTDALKFVKDGQTIGLGSGRAATAFVKSLGSILEKKKLKISAVPTSMQIKLVAEENKIPLLETDQIDKIDVVFDGADQIDSEKFMVKGGGGALFRENILISSARKVVIMADESKFVKKINRSIPVEIHPNARNIVSSMIEKIGGKPMLRTLERGYPFFTENGNIIFDCEFGEINNPRQLYKKIVQMAGVIEVGIFTRKPDIIYMAKNNGKFDIID